MSASTVSHAAAGPAAAPVGGGFDSRHPTLVVLGAFVFGCLVVGAAATAGPLAGIVAVLAIAAVLWAVANPTAGALAMVAVVPAISGFKRGLPIPGLRLSELLVVGFSTLVLVTADRSRWRRWQAFDWAALAYVLATFALGWLDTFGRGDALTKDDWGQLVGPLQFFLLYRAVTIALPARGQRARAVDFLLLGSVPVALLTIAQSFRVPGVSSFLVTLTGEDFSDRLAWTIARANGPFPHWTMLAGYLFGIVVICVAVLMSDPERRRRQIATAALALAAVSLVLTVTLAPMIGTVVATIALAAWYGRSTRVVVYLLVAMVALGIAFSPLLTQRTDDQFTSQASSRTSHSVVPRTVSNRYEFWTEQYLPALTGRWLTGYGPQLPPEVQWTSTESIYITMLMRGGLILLAAYAALMLSLGLLAARVGRSRERAAARLPPDVDELHPIEQALGRATLTMVVLLTVIQVIVPYFTTTGLPHVLWIAAAILMASLHDSAREPAL